MLILFILYNFAISIIFLAKQVFPFQVYSISSLFMTLPLLAPLPILKNFLQPSPYAHFWEVLFLLNKRGERRKQWMVKFCPSLPHQSINERQLL